MRPVIYFFGTFANGFASYPQDHTKSFFQDFIKKARLASQIVLHREGNLLYYGYVRRMNESDNIGICLCLDCIYIKTEYLFSVFDDAFADLVERGEILKINGNSEILWAIDNFHSEPVAITECSNNIIESINVSVFNSQPLPPVDFSVSVNDCLELGLDEGEDIISDATTRYCNLYIARKESEIERITSFRNLINLKNQELKKLNDSLVAKINQADNLKTENKKLQAQKKQYRNVVLLAFAILICGVGLFFLYDNLNSTQGQLTKAESTIVDKENAIRKLNASNNSLRLCLDNEKQEKRDLKNKLSDICTRTPFIITGYNINAEEVTIDYYAVEQKNITVYLKAINESEPEVVSNSHSVTIYEGNNRLKLRFNYRLNTENYYYVNILYNGNVIGGKRW